MVFNIFQDTFINKFIKMTKFLKIIRKKTEYQLINSFINELKTYLAIRKKMQKRFSFVLTGGKSPIKLYKKINKSKINFKDIDFFFGDERHVSKKSKFSNLRLIKNNLFYQNGIKDKQIFSIDTNMRITGDIAKKYENKIKKYFKNKKIGFDLILLGMGLDGHIASIFSNKKSKKLVTSVYREDFKRISMSIKLINKSKQIWLWLPTNKKSKLFQNFKNNKNIPVNLLKNKKLKIFSILQ